MSHILHIETSTKVCSVALGESGNLIDFKEEHSEKYVHAERLTILIKELMGSNDINFQKLSAIAISKGPGSYTGLRIGVSTAKGLQRNIFLGYFDTGHFDILYLMKYPS